MTLTGSLPDTATAPADHAAALDLRATLVALPRRQRATLVLRFYCDHEGRLRDLAAAKGSPELIFSDVRGLEILVFYDVRVPGTANTPLPGGQELGGGVIAGVPSPHSDNWHRSSRLDHPAAWLNEPGASSGPRRQAGVAVPVTVA